MKLHNIWLHSYIHSVYYTRATQAVMIQTIVTSCSLRQCSKLHALSSREQLTFNSVTVRLSIVSFSLILSSNALLWLWLRSPDVCKRLFSRSIWLQRHRWTVPVIGAFIERRQSWLTLACSTVSFYHTERLSVLEPVRCLHLLERQLRNALFKWPKICPSKGLHFLTH